MLLVSGYFAANVLALTVGGLVLPGYSIPAFMVGEWGLFLLWGVEVWEGEVVFGNFRPKDGILRHLEAGVARHELCADHFLWVTPVTRKEGRSQVGLRTR